MKLCLSQSDSEFYEGDMLVIHQSSARFYRQLSVLLGLLVTAIVAAGPTFGAGNEKLSYLPDGIANSSKPVEEAWLRYTYGQYQYALAILDETNLNAQNTKADFEDWNNEPGLYLVYGFMYGSDAQSRRSAENRGIPKEDPILDFADGIERYGNQYVPRSDGEALYLYSQSQLEKLIEIPFLKAIFKTANRSSWQDRLDEYMGGSLEVKKKIISDVQQELQDAPHRDRVIAAWASTWLTNHYWMSTLNDEDKFRSLQNLINELEKSLTGTVKVRASKDNKYYNEHL